MKFIKTIDTAVAADALLRRLQDELKNGQKVLWLVSGGSAVGIEAAILHKLKQSGRLEQLTIMLMDERYGPVGHADSNWHQLQEAGCDFTNIQAIPVMNEPLESFAATVGTYEQKITAAMAAADKIIGLFGLGPDGHTAGILPESPAAKEAPQLVVGYEAPPYQRITLTRVALLRVQAAYVFAFGEAKLEALTRLRHAQESFAQLPAQLLSELPEVYVYNDQIGEELT